VEAFGALVISADLINEARGLPFGGEGLPESIWAETLAIELEQLRRFAVEGRSVVVDDTHCYRWLRDRFRLELDAVGLSPVLLVFDPGREVLMSRLTTLRADRSRPVLSPQRFLEHLDTFEWPTADEGAINVTTPESLNHWIAHQVLLSKSS